VKLIIKKDKCWGVVERIVEVVVKGVSYLIFWAYLLLNVSESRPYPIR
jgi:hypothetical protein